jgi:site-specific DNA-methyltransferase (adenine-specific)
MLTDHKLFLLNEDCMEHLKICSDKYYDLAIVDPPYGIGAGKNGFSTIGNNADGLAKRKDYGAKSWDASVPVSEYFSELKRVSKNQIIWGGNYFLDNLGSTSCFLVWDKVNGRWSNADCELAWTSFKTAVRKYEFMWNGMLQGDMKNKQERIHPTEKPIALYKWILENYAKPGDKILDTHLGSMSIAIACYDLGFELTGCELDPDYFKAGTERLNNHILKYSPATVNPVDAENQYKLI